jgi:hypothetical protein
MSAFELYKYSAIHRSLYRSEGKLTYNESSDIKQWITNLEVEILFNCKAVKDKWKGRHPQQLKAMDRDLHIHALTYSWRTNGKVDITRHSTDCKWKG